MALFKNNSWSKLIDFLDYNRFNHVQYEPYNGKMQHKDMKDYFLTEHEIRIECKGMDVIFSNKDIFDIRVNKAESNILIITLKNLDKIFLYQGKKCIMHG